MLHLGFIIALVVEFLALLGWSMYCVEQRKQGVGSGMVENAMFITGIIYWAVATGVTLAAWLVAALVL